MELEELLPLMRALNDHEGIEISDERLRAALRTLLASPELGGVWMIEGHGQTAGYAIVTYGCDLGLDGRDAHLTEPCVAPAHRGGGSAAMALALLIPEHMSRGANAVHLHVRLDNPAIRLYGQQGFAFSSRRIMTCVSSRALPRLRLASAPARRLDGRASRRYSARR